MIEIPQYVKRVMDTIASANEESYVVGGSLRDSLLLKNANDYDLATSSLPERTMEIFDGWRVIATGLKHGTVTVISDGRPIEITTFRVDGGYTDSRHPDSVSFTRSIEEDVSRRDFTVNAMAYNERRGLVDLFGGQDDLRNGIIRAVGDPERRFEEDALRIMRAFRFSAQLGFKIEENTLKATCTRREGLAKIARERIATELFKLICSDFPERALEQMKESGVLSYALGDCLPDSERIALITKMPKDEGARLGFLLHGMSADSARRIINELRCSNKIKSTAIAVAEHAGESFGDRCAVSKLCARIGDRAEYALCASVLLGNSPAEVLDWLKNDRAPHSIAELKIGGGELLALGFSGREIGRVLASLLEDAIRDPAINERESLVALAKEKYGQYSEKGE